MSSIVISMCLSVRFLVNHIAKLHPFEDADADAVPEETESDDGGK